MCCRSILNLHTYRQYRSVWGQAWGFVQGGKGEGWVSLKISLAVTVSLAASHLWLNNGVPPQFREGVAPLTGARFPSCINYEEPNQVAWAAPGGVGFFEYTNPVVTRPWLGLASPQWSDSWSPCCPPPFSLLLLFAGWGFLVLPAFAFVLRGWGFVCSCS